MRDRHAWTPEEDARLRDLIAQRLGAGEVARIMGMKRKSILYRAARIEHAGWASEARKTPMPPDFSERWNELTNEGLCRHYGLSNTAVATLIRRAGLHGKRKSRTINRRVVIQKRQRASATTFKRSPNPMSSYGTCPTIHGAGDTSPARRAVDECLIKLAPTYRCDQTGAACVDGAFWRHGNVVLSDDEVIARSERRGWRPDAWKEVRAA